MRELKLKYVIELLSDLGSKSQKEATVMEAAQKRVQDALTKTNGEIGAMERLLLRVGGVGNAGIERQAQYLTTLAMRWTQVRSAASGAVDAMRKATDMAPAVAAGYMGGAHFAKPFIRDYANLESAQADLRIALMQKGGKVPAAYGQIMGQAQALGNTLPGTTKDYVSAAIELASQGVKPEAIINGGLKSSAYLGVLLGLDRGQAAETVAKIREAYGLHDNELPGLADTVQRNKFAFGLSAEGIRTAASYSGASLGALNLRGADNMSRILTLQGMANQAGMDPSSFGTNFAMMLTRLAGGPMLVEQAKRGLKGDAHAIMAREGIKFDFFDKDGHLKTQDGDPIAAMVHELSKLETVRKKLGEKSALEIASGMFGQEAARPAMILAKAGDEGYAAARARVADQANMDERITEKMSTFAAKLEALGGTVENVRAQMATQIGEGAKPAMDKANDALGPVQSFFENHPTAGTAAIGAGTALASWLAWRTGATAWRALAGRGAAAAGAEGVAAGLGMRFVAKLGLRAVPYAGLALGAWEAGGLVEDWAARQQQDAGVRMELRPNRTGRRLFAGMPAGPAGFGNEVPPSMAQLGTGLMQLGEGKLNIEVHVTDDRATATSNVTKTMPLIRIDGGGTNPASYAAR
jgi:TP901 family phage tail tape measure protein